MSCMLSYRFLAMNWKSDEPCSHQAVSRIFSSTIMSGANAPPQLAERQDIHKSCRTLETLVNMLNDYCEAAGAIVALQRKLSKALKEAAGLKTTNKIAGK